MNQEMNQELTQGQQIKEMVREKYSGIATQDKSRNQSSCCGSGACSDSVYTIMSEDYSRVQGYQTEADLGLGCGLPTQYAQIRPEDTVVDLGSGAGNDCFIARHETGESGRVIGIDFTPAMIETASRNAEKLGYSNVEFRQGDIDQIPLNSDQANVVVSNCVLNLVPDKEKVFREIYRILKPGGHFSISDIVLDGELPPGIRQAAELYAGCVSGAIQKEHYLELIRKTGFDQIAVLKNRIIEIPDDLLSSYLNKEEIRAFRESGTGIFSLSVYAEKPLGSQTCSPGCC